jgi:hypothetical protein
LIVELRRIRVTVLAHRIQPPFEDVPGDHERSRDGAISGDLRIGADVDQRSPSTHGVQRLSGIEPVQPASCVCKKLIDRGSCHAADLTCGVRSARLPGQAWWPSWLPRVEAESRGYHGGSSHAAGPGAWSGLPPECRPGKGLGHPRRCDVLFAVLSWAISVQSLPTCPASSHGL